MPGRPGVTRPYPVNCWITPAGGFSTPPRKPPGETEWLSPMLGMLIPEANVPAATGPLDTRPEAPPPVVSPPDAVPAPAWFEPECAWALESVPAGEDGSAIEAPEDADAPDEDSSDVDEAAVCVGELEPSVLDVRGGVDCDDVDELLVATASGALSALSAALPHADTVVRAQASAADAATERTTPQERGTHPAPAAFMLLPILLPPCVMARCEPRPRTCGRAGPITLVLPRRRSCWRDAHP